MAWANSQISDLIASTIENRTKKPSDNLSNNNALISYIKEQGNIKSISGGTKVLHETRYDDPTTNNVASYSGYDILNTVPDSPISALEFQIKHYAGSVSISDTEVLANSGKERMFELIAERIEICDDRLLNKIDLDLHLDGTGNSGKNLVGLTSMVTPTPSTGVYAGIDRALWPFVRNISTTSTIVNGAAGTVANVQNLMNDVCLKLTRGSDKINLIYLGLNFYKMYLSSLQANQFITNEKMAGAGFTALKFFGGGNAADVVLGNGIGGNAEVNTGYFLNTKHVFFRPHKDRDFVSIGGDRMSTNQLAITRFMGWSGAFTCDAPRLNGVATIL